MLNQIRFTNSIIVSNFRRLSFPLKVSLAVTYCCNLRCKMCNIWKTPYNRKELSVEEISRFFRLAPDFYWVGLTGGEVFLRNDLHNILDEIINHSRRLCAIHIATNAQLPEKIFEAIEYVRLRKKDLKIVFTVSIDGPPALHDSIRGKDKAWDTAIATFIKLSSLKNVKTQIGFTLSAYNTRAFPETFFAIKERYPKLSFDDININIYQKSSFYYQNQDMPEPNEREFIRATEAILKLDKDRFSFNNFLRRRFLAFYPEFTKNNKYPIPCQALSSTCFIDPYGSLYPCLMYNKELLNIRSMQKPLRLLWNSSQAKELSRLCRNKHCPGCWSPCDAYSAIAGSLLRTAQ